MKELRSIRIGLVLVTALTFEGCSARPVTAGDIRRYTNIALCPTAGIQDVATREERDTTPGFSFHAKLKSDAGCAMLFERQLASVAPTECIPDRVRSGGCYALGDETKTTTHTTIIARAAGGGVYDLRFFE